jgi:cell division protein FtsQ
VRIVEKDSTDYAYYLDEHANPIPLSTQFSPRLPIVTTNEIGFSKNELSLKSDLVSLSTYIQKDTFWNAAISQIDIDEKGRIVLIPVLGTQTILFGNISDMANKFDRLLMFYKHSVNRVDWSKYDELDVRFSGQVICRNHRGEILSVDPYNKLQQQQKSSTDKANQTPKPMARKPEPKKPEVKRAEAKKPEARKPESKKPALKKPEAKKAEVKKAEPKKSAVKKPETKKPLNP